MSLSVVILTKNEEENIEACLQSVAWADEILVIDDNSSDNTVEIAKKLGATVYSHPLDNNFAAQRNFALEKAKYDWVLFVDADERVSADLAYEIQHAMSTNIDGFSIKRKDTIWGNTLLHGETGNVQLIRMGRKTKGKWEGKVHEVWNIQGKVKTLQHALKHYPHQSVASFLKEINFYTDLRAQELYKQGIKTNWLEIILYPKAKFLNNYLLKQGFRDGIPGLLSAMIMGLHSFLVRGKLWQLWQNN